jgi:hypothetical protein
MAKLRAFGRVIDSPGLAEQRPEQHAGVTRLLDPARRLERDLHPLCRKFAEHVDAQSLRMLHLVIEYKGAALGCGLAWR